MTLRLLNPYGHGRLVLLEVNYTKDHHTNFIYLIAVCLGVVGVRHVAFPAKDPRLTFIACQGVYGAIWAKLNIAWSKRVRAGTSIKRYPILEVLLASPVSMRVMVNLANSYTNVDRRHYKSRFLLQSLDPYRGSGIRCRGKNRTPALLPDTNLEFILAIRRMQWEAHWILLAGPRRNASERGEDFPLGRGAHRVGVYHIRVSFTTPANRMALTRVDT